MSRKVIFALSVFGGIALLVCFLVWTKVQQFGAMGKAGGQAAEASKLIQEAEKLMEQANQMMQPPPESVSTSLVERRLWQETLQAVGSIEPIRGVRLDAEVPGIVTAINFQNGQAVDAGDVLVQLDTAPETALLNSNKANAELARIELERAQRLRNTNSVAQSQLDQAQATFDVAMAQVKNIEAIIDQKTIRAPFKGRVGIRQINLGQYLSAGAAIVTIQSYDEVFVNFTLPQQMLSKIETGMELLLKSDAYPSKSFTGRLTAISPQIDPITRTVKLQGTLSNSDGDLKPGLFVNIEVIASKINEVLTIPATAIAYAPYGNSIFKIKRQKNEATGETVTTVKQSFIRIGERRGDFVSVLEGLEEGDEVVSAGAFKLRNEMPVSIQNDLAPAPEIAPTPNNS